MTRIMRSATVLLFCTGALMNAAMAQPVYKTVGPDGKITFSDEPPAAGKTTALEGYGPPPPKEPAPDPRAKAAELTRQAQERYSAKSAKAATAAAPAVPAAQPAATQATIDPALGEAVIGVLGFEDIVKQTENLCIATLPTSFKKYGGAADGWRQRNAAVLQQQRMISAQAFTAAQRSTIGNVVKTKNAEQLAPVLKAPTASKIKWCDQSADEMNRGVLDFSKHQTWINTLGNWRAPAH